MKSLKESCYNICKIAILINLYASSLRFASSAYFGTQYFSSCEQLSTNDFYFFKKFMT